MSSLSWTPFVSKSFLSPLRMYIGHTPIYMNIVDKNDVETILQNGSIIQETAFAGSAASLPPGLCMHLVLALPPVPPWMP